MEVCVRPMYILFNILICKQKHKLNVKQSSLESAMTEKRRSNGPLLGFVSDHGKKWLVTLSRCVTSLREQTPPIVQNVNDLRLMPASNNVKGGGRRNISVSATWRTRGWQRSSASCSILVGTYQPQSKNYFTCPHVDARWKEATGMCTVGELFRRSYHPSVRDYVQQFDRQMQPAPTSDSVPSVL